MPNSKSAAKRLRTAEKARQRNKAEKSRLRTYLRRFQAAVDAGEASSAQDLYKTCTSLLDKASKHGAIHDNQAARRKSRMAIKLNGIAATS